MTLQRRQVETRNPVQVRWVGDPPPPVGPSVEDLLRWMVTNADRNPSAIVIIGEQSYKASLRRNGSIVLHPQ